MLFNFMCAYECACMHIPYSLNISRVKIFVDSWLSGDKYFTDCKNIA